MTSKQRAQLRSLANPMESIIQVGKNAVTPELTTAVDEALEKRELIKLTVLNNCAIEVSEIAEIIRERTHSETIQVIGKKIVLYRRSKTNPIIELVKK